MKTLFKVLGIIVLVIFILILTIPFLFKGKIAELAKKELNNSVNATVEFSDIDLSLISNFPNFTLGIDDLSVTGKGEFANDTLADIDRLAVTIGLFSVIEGDNYLVKKVNVRSPRINVRVLENGKANYDITPPGDGTETKESADESDFNLELKKFEITNGTIIYHDESLATQVTMNDLQLSLSGNFSADATMINTNLTASALDVDYEGIEYLSGTRVMYQANIDADLKNDIYKLGKNELILNNLVIGFDGSVTLMDEGINLILSFDAPGNDFKSFLSLVPAVFTKDFDNITTSGELALNGSVKGMYYDDHLPSFDVNLAIEDAMFKYPDLPMAVKNIRIKANVTNPGGSADKTVIDIPTFTMTLGNNPIRASLLVKNPVSDPDIQAKVNGEVDLASVKDYYPLEGEEELSGVLVADITLNGKLSAIEQQQYNDFVALGSLLVKNLKYNTSALKETVNISTAQLNFSPRYLDLVSFEMNLGESDFSASGKIENYLAYALSDGTLRGNFTAESSYLNIDELLPKSSDQPEDEGEKDDRQPEGEPSSDVLEVPEKVDFDMNVEFGKLIYDKLELENVKGNILVRNETINLQKLRADIIGGQMEVSGSYSSAEISKPAFDLDFSLSGIEISESYNHFALIRKYLPLAKKTNGKFSASVSLNALLDSKMMPVYETMDGNGSFSTTKIYISELNTLTEIARALSYDELKSMELNEISLSFRFVNGKLITQPFNLQYKNISAQLEGWTSFDQSIDYLMTMNIPRKELGADANKLMDDLIKEAEKAGIDYELPETIKVGISIAGTLTDPKIKTDLKQSGSDLVKKAKEEIVKEVKKEVQQQVDNILAEADRQAKAIMDEANKQAKYFRENTDEAISKLNTEADKQANKLMEEAKKQGVIAELAAKEAVKKLREEADNQIEALRNDTDNQVNKIIDEAKKQANKIKQEARRRADALLEE